jgi:hypothetical protein
MPEGSRGGAEFALPQAAVGLPVALPVHTGSLFAIAACCRCGMLALRFDRVETQLLAAISIAVHVSTESGVTQYLGDLVGQRCC